MRMHEKRRDAAAERRQIPAWNRGQKVLNRAKQIDGTRAPGHDRPDRRHRCGDCMVPIYYDIWCRNAAKIALYSQKRHTAAAAGVEAAGREGKSRKAGSTAKKKRKGKTHTRAHDARTRARQAVHNI